VRARPSLVFALALLAFVSLGLPDAVVGVAWPEVRRAFALPVDRLGVLLFTTMGGYLVSSFASGAIVRRTGVGGLLIASSLLVVASCAGYASAPSWPFLVAAAVPGGLGAGAIDAAINAYAAARFPAGRVAWLHACWGVGATLGPLLMTAVRSAGLEWRWGYGILAAVLSVLAAGFYRTRGLWEGSAETGDRHGARPAAIGDSLRRPIVRANVLLFFLYTGVEGAAGQWAYTLLTESRGMAAGPAGVSVGAYWASLTVGRIVFGILAHHVDPAVLLRACVAALPLGALGLAAARGPAVDVASLVLIAFTGAPVFPLLIAGTPGRVGGLHAPNAVGFQVSAACVGAAALPAGIGVLARAWGLETIALCLVASALAVVLLHEAVLYAERRARRAALSRR
jgi:fucose permease